jgi:hypothetical protein
MSVVTSIILTTYLDEQRAIQYINKFLDITLRDAGLSAAGGKAMQMEVYCIAINHINIEKFTTICVWRRF